MAEVRKWLAGKLERLAKRLNTEGPKDWLVGKPVIVPETTGKEAILDLPECRSWRVCREIGKFVTVYLQFETHWEERCLVYVSKGVLRVEGYAQRSGPTNREHLKAKKPSRPECHVPKNPGRYKRNREFIESTGLPFVERANGMCLLFRIPDMPKADFYPSTGNWRVAGKKKTYQGDAEAFYKWFCNQAKVERSNHE